jgi:hypothetical protein
MLPFATDCCHLSLHAENAIHLFHAHAELQLPKPAQSYSVIWPAHPQNDKQHSGQSNHYSHQPEQDPTLLHGDLSSPAV